MRKIFTNIARTAKTATHAIVKLSLENCRVANKTGILCAIKTRKAGNAGGQRVWRRFLGEI